MRHCAEVSEPNAGKLHPRLSEKGKAAPAPMRDDLQNPRVGVGVHRRLPPLRMVAIRLHPLSHTRTVGGRTPRIG